MKVLIWACGFEQRFAGQYVATEAKRQGFDVMVTGSRRDPRLMRKAFDEYKPDVVFCFALMPNFKSYYEYIKQHGAKLVLWYPDMTESTRDRMWRESLNNVADVLVFSILETAQRYSALAPTVLWMPQYFDTRFCSRNGTLPKRLDPAKPIYDVCFIGSCDRLRRKWLDELEKNYNCRFARDGISGRHEIRGWNMAEIYAQSKVAINIQRERYLNPGPYVVSNRIYNAMGSGACFLNHSVENLGLVFEEGIHCVSHDDTLTGLRRQLDFLLCNDKRREDIASNGQQTILKYHTLEQRVKEYWQVMELLHTNHHTKIAHGAYGKWVRRV